MASSNRGLLIGCVAVTVLGGGCVVTGIAAGAAWWLLGRESVSTPIAFPSIAPEAPPPVGYPPVPSGPAPMGVAPTGVAPTGVAPTGPVAVAPVPTEPAPAEPAGVMHLTSVPDGARVSEGGVELGVTPLDVPVAPRGGSRRLSVAADGYHGSDVTIFDTPGTQQITLQAREPEPAPARPATASAGSSGSRGTSGSSGSSGSGGSSGSTGSSARAGSTTTDRPVAATIRPSSSGTSATGTTSRTGTSGTTTGSTGTSRPPRTGALSHDDF